MSGEIASTQKRSNVYNIFILVLTVLSLAVMVALLRIDGRKAVLTEAGGVLLRRSRQLVKQASQLEDLAHHMEQGWEAEVRLVVDAAYPSARLVRAAQFRFLRERCKPAPDGLHLAAICISLPRARV